MSRRGPYFLDACVPMYMVGRDDPYREPCTRIIAAVGQGLLHAVTDVEVIQEIAYRFDSLKRRADAIRYGGSFAKTVGEVLPVAPGDALRALDLMQDYPFLSTRDAIHAAVMEAGGLTHIVTADRHFDRLPGITRIHPAELAW